MKTGTILSTAVLIAAFAAGRATADNVVNISLWDKGESAMDNVGKHSPIGLAVEGADPALATMGVTLDVAEVPAGEITFQITSDSGGYHHAVLISPVADATAPLPYLSADHRVDEAAVVISANLGELRPHDVQSKAATLTPGTYILYCNIAGHYAMGMWTLLSVTE